MLDDETTTTSEPAADEQQSKNAAHIRYRPVRKASRKGAHERTVGHEWRCMHCNAIVHEEPLVGFNHEETEDEEGERHLRVQQACAGHDPCPRLDAARKADGVGGVDGDDPNLPAED